MRGAGSLWPGDRDDTRRDQRDKPAVAVRWGDAGGDLQRVGAGAVHLCYATHPKSASPATDAMIVRNIRVLLCVAATEFEEALTVSLTSVTQKAVALLKGDGWFFH